MSDAGFLLKHKALIELVNSKKDEFGASVNVYSSEQGMSLGSFPAVGVFLGFPRVSSDTTTFVPLEYHFMLSVANVYDNDDPSDMVTQQYAMYNLLETVIDKCSLQVSSSPEPMISIAVGEGALITGWTIMIKYNS